MADISTYIEYFEKLAKEHKEILHGPGSKHFFMMDINELLSTTNSTARYPAILLLKLSVKAIDKKEDNRLIAIEGGFLVIDHCKNIYDFAAKGFGLICGNSHIFKVLYTSRCVFSFGREWLQFLQFSLASRS